MVERKSRYVVIGKLRARTTTELDKRVVPLIERQNRTVRTLTADNGTEFHDHKTIEAKTDANFYFTTPHHSWKRGLNENTNDLIRHYLPKGKSIAKLTQFDCNAIARRLNRCPRKLLEYKTSEQLYSDI